MKTFDRVLGLAAAPAPHVLHQALLLNLPGIGQLGHHGEGPGLQSEEQALEHQVGFVSGADQVVDVDRVNDQQQVDAGLLHRLANAALARLKLRQLEIMF